MAKQLTEVEQFYIRNNKDISAEELANKLPDGIGPKTVQNYLDFLDQEVVEKEPEIEEQPLKLPMTTGDVMIRDKERGIAMMNQAASERSEENAAKIRKHTERHASARNRDVIHKPLGTREEKNRSTISNGNPKIG